MSKSNILIEGLKIISYKENDDNRGKSLKPFSHSLLKELNIEEFIIKEVLFSYSKKNVIRGMHLQICPYASSKIVSLISGHITDVLIDLRLNSKTFLVINEFELYENSRKAIFVPKGVAHGFKVLSDSATVLYLMDMDYSFEKDISLNPLTIGYDWNVENPIISERDLAGLTIENFSQLQNTKDFNL